MKTTGNDERYHVDFWRWRRSPETGKGSMALGIVSDYVRELIAKQVDDRRLVVWFDPDRDYAGFVSTLSLPETTVARYEGSFFQLRHEISALLEDEQPPRLVVYMPLAEDATENALIELIATGVVLKPGQQPWQRNTRLSVIAKAAVKDALGPEQAQRIERQVNEGKLTLADLDHVIERLGGAEPVATLHLIFGTGNPEDIALEFLSGTTKDGEIAARKAQGDLAHLLTASYGVALPSVEDLDELRARLARHLLCTELLATLRPPISQQLSTINVAEEPATREACVRLVRRWRETRGSDESYAAHANRVERDLGLTGISFTLEQAQDCETFGAIDDAVEAATEHALTERPSAELIAIAKRRGASFWAMRQPERQQRWMLVGTIGNLLLRADDIEPVIKRSQLSASDLFQAYVAGEQPWSQLDTLYRQLEQQTRRFTHTSHDDALNRLIAVARRRYMDVGDQLASRFTRAFAAAGFSLPQIPPQRDIYQRLVAPALREGKTAYMLVDALRYEMANELARNLATSDYEVTLEAALGTAPTITEIGMAALLPHGQDEGRVVAAGPSKLGLKLGETLLRDRKGRITWLKEHAGLNANGHPAHVYDVTLDDLLTLRSDTERQAREADLLFVTSGEIDSLAESDNISLAWTVMDQLLAHVARGLRRLADLGCQRIIVAADHGYLFGDELDESMKLDPPGGRTADLHRRVWVGTGAARSDAYLHAPLRQLGPSDETLEIAVPWGFGAFKVQGGARAYFHGGLSLPELVVPVLTITPVANNTPATSTGQDIAWTLEPRSRNITSTFCSFVVTGQRVGLFEVAPPLVRLELRLGRDTIAQAISATYGFSEATKEIQMAFAEGDDTGEVAPNTVTLALSRSDVSSDAVIAHLLDALTNRELARLEGLRITSSLFTL